MSGGANNPLSKVVGRIFPKVPDFINIMFDLCLDTLSINYFDSIFSLTDFLHSTHIFISFQFINFLSEKVSNLLICES